MNAGSDYKTTPKLRFREFIGDWKIKKIQKLLDEGVIIDHLDGNHGALYPKSEEFTKKGVPYVTANDFIDGFVDINGCRRLPENRARQFKKGIARNGDVLFAHNATVGPTSILQTSSDYVILSTTATYYRCNIEKLYNKFLVKVFESNFFIKQYSRVMSQSTRNQVPITMQRTFFIPLPPLLEQQKIAEFLSSVDKKIQLLEKKKEQLELYKKGVMQKIFSREIRFKDSNGNSYPDWEEKKITEIAKTSIGLVTSMTKHYAELGTPLIRNSDILQNKIKKDKLIYLNKEFDEDNKGRRLLLNDIVTVHTGDIGVSAVIESDLDGCQGFATLNTRINNQDVLCSAYLCWYYNSVKNIRYAISMATGDGRSNYNLKDFNKAIIPIPNIEEQQKISNFLSSLSIKIEFVSTQIEKTKAFKKGLLQQMFV